MIPALPPDRELPTLAGLFDEQTMAAALSGQLMDRARAEIAGCRPRYVRYKPETSCLVQYDIDLRSVEGDLAEVVAHVKISADHRARSIVTSQSMLRSQERTADLQQRSAIRLVAFLPEVGGLLQVYPIDHDLRFLTKAADSGRMQKTLRKSSPQFDQALVTAEPELIRYKPQRKALLRYELTGAPVQRMYGKVHAVDQVELLTSQTNTLIQAGAATPGVVFALPQKRFIAHAEAPGVRLAELRGSPRFAAAMPLLAEHLARLQTTSIAENPIHTLADIGGNIRATALWLGRIVPHLAGRLTQLGERIILQLQDIEPRMATCHGDFYDDQVLIDDSGMTLIDLDELQTSHPLVDTGNMLAHLSLGIARGEKLTGARDAFLDASLELSACSRTDAELFEALAILKLAPGPFRRLESDWPAGIERIVELAESRCPAGSGPGPSRLSQLPIDQALPQLETLLDRKAMPARFASALDEPEVMVTSVDLVRHKPGRRAVLRYVIDRAGSPEVIYGKTFASERGPRVHRTNGQAWDHQAFGDAARVPEPVAYLDDLKLVIQRSVSGVPVERRLLAGDIALAGRIATVLYRFHTSGLQLDRVHDLEQELGPLELRTGQVATVYPARGECAERCLSMLQKIHWEALPWRLRPVHRDFYHDQLLIDDDRLAVLDLDDAAMSEPAVDVANFVAHLMLLGIKLPGHGEALASVESAFLRQYDRLDPALDRTLTRLLIGTTMIRLAGIHVSRINGERVASQLLQAAGVLLSEHSRPTNGGHAEIA